MTRQKRYLRLFWLLSGEKNKEIINKKIKNVYNIFLYRRKAFWMIKS